MGCLLKDPDWMTVTSAINAGLSPHNALEGTRGVRALQMNGGIRPRRKCASYPQLLEVLEEEVEEEAREVLNNTRDASEASGAQKLVLNNWKINSSPKAVDATHFNTSCAPGETSSYQNLKFNNIECYLKSCASFETVSENLQNYGEETKASEKGPKDTTEDDTSDWSISNKRSPDNGPGSPGQYKGSAISWIFKRKQGLFFGYQDIQGYISGRFTGIYGETEKETNHTSARQVPHSSASATTDPQDALNCHKQPSDVAHTRVFQREPRYLLDYISGRRSGNYGQSDEEPQGDRAEPKGVVNSSEKHRDGVLSQVFKMDKRKLLGYISGRFSGNYGETREESTNTSANKLLESPVSGKTDEKGALNKSDEKPKEGVLGYISGRLSGNFGETEGPTSGVSATSGSKISASSAGGKSQDKCKEGVLSQVFKMNRRRLLGHVSGRFTGIYSEASRYVETAKGVIHHARQQSFQGLASRAYQSFNTNMNGQMPFLQAELAPPEVEVNNNQFGDHLQYDASSLSTCVQGVQNESILSEESVIMCNIENAKVFSQKLPLMPTAIVELQSLPLEEMLNHVSHLVPEVQSSCTLQGVFWLRLASTKQSTPQPGVLLLFDKIFYAIVGNYGPGEDDDNDGSWVVLFRLVPEQITDIQVGLAGNHVRILGDLNEVDTLVLLTCGLALTQELCLALLEMLDKTLAQEKQVLSHPLLSGDLTELSLDWTTNVPDLVLNDRIKVSARFKRALADLVCVLHGNMDRPKPVLAEVQLLVYASVRVEQTWQDRTLLAPDSPVPPDGVAMFFLSDTHLGLIREDAVFYPMPRFSTAIPTCPQFDVYELRRRSEVKCLLVKECESCVTIEIVLHAQTCDEASGATPERFRKTPNAIWNLAFGCGTDALKVIKHLCD